MNACGYYTRMVKMVIKKLMPFSPTTKKHWDWFFKENVDLGGREMGLFKKGKKFRENHKPSYSAVWR